MSLDGRSDDGLEIVEEIGTANTNSSTNILNKCIEGSGSVVLMRDGAAMQREHPSFPTTMPSHHSYL